MQEKLCENCILDNCKYKNSPVNIKGCDKYENRTTDKRKSKDLWKGVGKHKEKAR